MHTILRRQVLLKDAVYKIAELAREEDPEIARVYVETSDQGEYLTISNVTYRDTPDAQGAGYLDDQVHEDTAVSMEDWATSLSYDDAHDDAPGWVTTNARGGYYYIDVDAALATEAPVEISPVDLVVGELARHRLPLTGRTCKCGTTFPREEEGGMLAVAHRKHVAEKIVEVLS